MFPWLLAIVLATTQAVPPAGAIAFGSPERAVTAALGKPCRTWEDRGFTWRRYQPGNACIDAGFYRDKLGRLRIRPAQSLAWPQARAWALAALPGFTRATRRHASAEAWDYFQPITLDGVPFEVGLHFSLKAGRVTAIDGEMNWLD